MSALLKFCGLMTDFSCIFISFMSDHKAFRLCSQTLGQLLRVSIGPCLPVPGFVELVEGIFVSAGADLALFIYFFFSLLRLISVF